MLLWAFAFLRMPTASPEWLVRAQSVCFGTNASGLPDASGWTILILSPLSLISALYIAYYEDLAQKIRQLGSISKGKVFLALIAFVGLAEAGWVTTEVRQRLRTFSNIEAEPGALPANYPKTSTHAIEFSLLDQFGKKVNLSDFKGRPVLLSFVFAHCQSVCPVLVQSLKEGRQLARASDPALILITLDPWRDTPASLPSLAQKWGLARDERVLSGPADEVEQLIKSYGVPTSRDLKSGDVVHPALVYLIDKTGNLVYSFNNPSPAWLAQAIERL